MKANVKPEINTEQFIAINKQILTLLRKGIGFRYYLNECIVDSSCGPLKKIVDLLTICSTIAAKLLKMIRKVKRHFFEASDFIFDFKSSLPVTIAHN